MSKPTISKKIKKGPPEAKQEVHDFVDFLYERYVKDYTKKSAKKSILESSFFGMWKDREDRIVLYGSGKFVNHSGQIHKHGYWIVAYRHRCAY